MFHATPTLILALVASSAEAAPKTVCGTGCDYSALVDALGDPAANPVQLQSGNYGLAQHDQVHDVVIEGPAAGLATINCSGGPCAYSTTGADVVWRRNIRFQPTNGAPVHVRTGGTLELDGVHIPYHDAQGANGGLIQASGTHVIVRNSTFDHVDSAGQGGHILAQAGSLVELHGTTVRNGRAVQGAGVWLSGSQLQAYGGRFEGNESTGDGGCIYCDGNCDITIDGTVFAASRAVNGGGLSQRAGGSLVITGATFENSQSIGGAGRGAAVHVVGVPSVDIDETSFENGLAARGAGIYVDPAGAFTDVDITGGSFTNGQATDGGGAVYAANTTGLLDLAVSGVAFHNGHGDSTDTDLGQGGAIRMEGGTLAVFDSDFWNNRAQSGGAIALNLMDAVVIADSLFRQNQAHDGGAIRVRADPLNAYRNVFCENGAVLPPSDGGQRGGAVVQYFETATWSNNTFVRNNSVAEGGAWYGQGLDATHEFSVFSQNGAGLGTAIYQVSGSLWIDHSIFDSQTATYLQGSGAAASADYVMAYNSGTTSNVSVGTVVPGMPTYLTATSAGCDVIDLWPTVSAPQIDAGDSGMADLDGSVADLGISGGPLADPWRVDADGDTFTPTQGDCDDTDATIHPGATEDCDAVDRDCDGDPSLGATDAGTFYADTDTDGYGDASAPVDACVQPANTAANDQDCDDGDTAIHPAASEVCDGVDNDCDSLTDQNLDSGPMWFKDGDGDGHTDFTVAPQLACTQPNDTLGSTAPNDDCNDNDASVHPLADELCDDVDHDCDGELEVGAIDVQTWYADTDLDGFGSSAGPGVIACTGSPGSVTNNQDCNDADDEVYPDAEETCDGQDQDCDGQTDEDAIDQQLWYTDVDGDGFGVGAGTLACEAAADQASVAGDCDDQDPSRYPGAPGLGSCDVLDEDGDGCAAAVYGLECRDCDDNDPARSPDFQEVPYDGIDNDCSGGDLTDVDGDGHSHDAHGGDDCDDTDPERHPDAVDIPGDGIDQDCDDRDAVVDLDGDGAAADVDCDDTDPSVHPGAQEALGDGVDRDCDGIWSVSVVGGSGCASLGAGGAPPWLFGLPLVLALVGRRRE